MNDNMVFKLKDSVNQRVEHRYDHFTKLYIKREDKIHPIISGNKYRKLKYNITFIKSQGYSTLLTFGGAFSNHIAATAEAGKVYGIKTIGIIRGEELQTKIEENDTLNYAQSCGMHFKFISRANYREKNSISFIKSLKKEFGLFYTLPEGGTNEHAIKGCEEILTEADKEFDYICCPVGTGGTVAGLINCSKPSQQVFGFSALKDDFLQEDISKFVTKNNWKLNLNYHFGGYAKVNEDLIRFINKFKKEQSIQLDPVYTGKMMYGIYDLIEQSFFKKGSKILAIHTGGLQGIKGMNKLLVKKGLHVLK